MDNQAFSLLSRGQTQQTSRRLSKDSEEKTAGEKEREAAMNSIIRGSSG